MAVWTFSLAWHFLSVRGESDIEQIMLLNRHIAFLTMRGRQGVN